MKSLSLLRGLLVSCLLVCGQASAGLLTTWTYTSNLLTPGGTVTASVEVDYVGPNTYVWNAGITRITLTAGGAMPTPPGLFELSTSDPDVMPDPLGNNSISFGSNGLVTEWMLTLFKGMNDLEYTIQTLGVQDSQSNSGDDSYTYKDSTGAETTGTSIDPGVWQQESNGVPEPNVLALVGLGLLGIGVSRRRKQK